MASPHRLFLRLISVVFTNLDDFNIQTYKIALQNTGENQYSRIFYVVSDLFISFFFGDYLNLSALTRNRAHNIVKSLVIDHLFCSYRAGGG